jgi:hypothetical protein
MQTASEVSGHRHHPIVTSVDLLPMSITRNCQNLQSSLPESPTYKPALPRSAL